MKPTRLLLLFLFALALLTPLSADTINHTTYTFTGTCTLDCTGIGTATLVLNNYTPGAALTLDNFVSLVYNSNFLTNWGPNLTVTGLSGSIPASLPAAADVSVFFEGNNSFLTSTRAAGLWCVGSRCAADAGSGGVWAAGAPAGVPEPSTIVLSAAGIAGLALLRRKR